MGRGYLAALLVIGLVSTAQPVRAELMDTTASLRAGQLGLGAEFMAGFQEPTPMVLTLREAVGLASGVDLQFRQGFGLNQSQPFLFGGGLKWTLLHGSRKHTRPGISIYAGGHYRTESPSLGGDANITFDYPFRGVRPYLALVFHLISFPGDLRLMFDFVGGARISMGSFDLYIEMGWDISGPRNIGAGPYGRFVASGVKFHI